MFIGEKIKFCAISEKHTDYFFQMFNNIEIQRNADVVKHPKSIEQVKKIVEENQDSNEYCMWFVIEDLNGICVGDLDINDADIRNGTFKYGISILPEYRKLGYAKEAILMILNYYFNELRFNKAKAEIHDFNKASIEMNESIGFIREGAIRDAFYINGKYITEYIYGMTRAEFNQKYQKEGIYSP